MRICCASSASRIPSLRRPKKAPLVVSRHAVAMGAKVSELQALLATLDETEPDLQAASSRGKASAERSAGKPSAVVDSAAGHAKRL